MGLNNGNQAAPVINIAKIIDNWLFKSQNLRTTSNKIRAKFWPSELAYCDREIYHRWKGQHRAKYRPTTLRMFEDGSVAEDRITRYLKEMGLLISAQEQLPQNPFFSGRIDHLYSIGGEKVINEFKRVNNNSFLRIKSQNQANFAHEVQMNVYLWAFKLGLGTILYENRDTAEFLCFHVKQNEGLLRWVFEKIAKLKNYIDNEISPPRCRSTGRWICPYCYPLISTNAEEDQRYENLIIKPLPESIGTLAWMDQNHIQPNK